MARKPAPKHVINPAKQLHLRRHFLGVVSTVCPEVLTSLKTEVYPGSITVNDWAERFGFAETWVKLAARETTHLWASYPQLLNCEGWPMPGRAQNVLEEEQHIFTISILVPNDLAFRRAWFSWDALKEYLRAQVQANLDRELEAFKEQCIASINAKETPLPQEMDKKMAAVALHICRRWSPEKIGNLEGYASTRSNVFRWIRDMTKLLDLEVSRRRRGK